MGALAEFDFAAFADAFDTERRQRGLGWYDFADKLWDQSAELNARRQQDRLTWAALAAELGCTPARLTNLRTARLADLALTMRVTQYLERPAAAFIHAAGW